MTQDTPILEEIRTPLAGTIIGMEEVPDPVFASKKMGDGFGIVPTGNDVVAPASGRIAMVAKTGHAFAIKTDTGLEILVHMGIDTVELNGAPFALTIARGDIVEAGQPVGTMDLAAVEAAGKSTTTAVIFTNLKRTGGALSVTPGIAALGDITAGITPGESAAPVSPSSAPPAPVAVAAPADDPVRARLTGFDLLAYDIVAGIGGAENVRNVIHCITRVRFYLKDESIADDAGIANLDGVIDVMKAGGQYQVVVGAVVEDVYAAVTKLTGSTGDTEDVELVDRPTTLVGWVKLAFSSLIGVITASMIPIVGVMAASGILKGLLAMLTQFGAIESTSNTYTLISAMSDAMFFFLPVFVGFTSAKRLGANPIIVAIIGGVMVYPSVVTLSKSETVVAQLGSTIFNADFFGIPISIPAGNAYGYSIFPIIVASYLASKLEPWLKRVLPAVIRSIFGPLIEIVVVCTLIFVVFGPIIMMLSGGLASGINSLIGFNYPIAGFVIGALFQVLVIFGLHWAVIPLVAAEIAMTGASQLNAVLSVTMIAQGGGVLAVWLKTRDKKIKELAGASTISAFCGITEPAMYGINLKYGKIFITASIGAAVGGLVTGLLNVTMYGFAGSFVGFASFINPAGIDHSFTGYWIASLTALVVSVALTYMYGFKESDLTVERTVKKVRLGRREPAAT